MELQQRFSELLLNYTKNTELSTALWHSIYNGYTEKHRAYHNLQHLTEMFTYFDLYKSELENPDTIAFSIFYHDVIYKVWNKDNEEKSADFAAKELATILNDEMIQEIHQQIIATKTHISTNRDTKWLLDFDLAVLGQSKDVYTKYTNLIRKEYRTVPNFIYNKGRKKVLQHFIKKTFIFATQKFRNKHEEQAKINLAYELQNL